MKILSRDTEWMEVEYKGIKYLLLYTGGIDATVIMKAPVPDNEALPFEYVNYFHGGIGCDKDDDIIKYAKYYIDHSSKEITMKLAYQQEYTGEITEVEIDAETTGMLYSLGIKTDMGIPELCDTMFAKHNDERLIAYVTSEDKEDEVREYNMTLDLAKSQQ